MKKILVLLLIGVALLISLSFVPSNVINYVQSDENTDSYLTLVPAKPPATPPKK